MSYRQPLLNWLHTFNDAGMLSRNRGLRTAGFSLEKAGKVARTVGLVLDTVESLVQFATTAG